MRFRKGSLTEIQSQISTEDMDDLSMFTFHLSQAATNVSIARWIACKRRSICFPHNEVDPVSSKQPWVDNGQRGTSRGRLLQVAQGVATETSRERLAKPKIIESGPLKIKPQCWLLKQP